MLQTVHVVRVPLLALAVTLLTQGCATTGKDWPQWGGPDRNFKVFAPALADQWPEEGPPKVWEREFGKGYSAITVANNTLVTMHRNEAGDEDVVAALDPADGSTKWEHRYAAPVYEGQDLRFGKGPNASPLIANGKVYTIGFTGIMHCLDLATGNVVWMHDLTKEYNAKVHDFGYSISPMMYDGKIITAVGGDMYGLIAFNATNGTPMWMGDAMDVSYASPVVINVDGQDQFVVMSSDEVIGVSTEGKKLWSHPCVNQYKNNATDPLWFEGNLLWAATQLDGGTRCIRLTRSGEETQVEEVWTNDKIKIFHWNAIPIGNHVYASIGSNTTFFSAINAETGEIKWQARGYHKANSIYADGKIIFLDENGKLVMARVTPESFEKLAETQLTEKASWTVPTLVGDTLFVRDNAKIMALDLGA